MHVYVETSSMSYSYVRNVAIMWIHPVWILMERNLHDLRITVEILLRPIPVMDIEICY